MAAAHHRADAVEQQRATDHAGRRGRRGSEKRAAAAAQRATAARHRAGRRAAAVIVPWRLRLLQHLAAVPDRAAGLGRRDVRHRTVRLALSEDRVAHRIEEAAGLILLGRCCGLQFLDAAVGALQRLVLHQHGLHQRVDRIGRACAGLARSRRPRRDRAARSPASRAGRKDRRSIGVLAVSWRSPSLRNAGQM